MEIEKELLIKELYQKGIKISDIKTIAKCSNSSIDKIRDKYNLPKRGKNFITEPLDEEKVIEMYQTGYKISDIRKACKCGTNTISRIVRERGISLRTDGIRKLNKNLDKFYDLSSPETQYWIGYICADGNIEYRIKDGTCLFLVRRKSL